MGTSALRSHLKINHLGPAPGSTCLALSLRDTRAVHIHGKVLQEDEGDEQLFLQLPRTALTEAERSPSRCCRAGMHKGRSVGCVEGAGRVVHGQSHPSPSRHTWTSARLAARLPESLVPRAEHGEEGPFYLT